MNKDIVLFLMLLLSIGSPAQSEGGLVSFYQGQRASIVLPVLPDVNKGVYYRLSKCENNQIVFVEESSPQSGVPYIIVPKEDFKVDLSALNLKGDAPEIVSIDGISFVGFYHGNTIGCKDTHYYIIIDNTPDCIKEEDNMENPAIGALRAFLDVDWRLYPNNGKQMEVILMNNTVSVKNSSASSSEKVKFLYDLQGRSLNCKPENGIYIEKKIKRCQNR